LQKAYRNGQKVEFFFNGEGADGHVGWLFEEADQVATLVAPKMLQFVIYEAKRPQVAETARPQEADYTCDACGEGDHDQCEWERWSEEEQIMYTCGCGTGHD
jgi:hypothetical protein